MREKELDLPMDVGVISGHEPSSAPPATGGAAARPGGDAVTAGLKELFKAIADEPIPEDFLRLLDQIDADPGRAATLRKGGMA